MVTVLEECTSKEQRSVVYFWGKRTRCKNVHKGMSPVYGGKSLPHKVVHNFSQGRSKVADDALPDCFVEIAQKQLCSRWKS
jgi:hypothetical protein